jgi:hypothetical protein
MGDILFIAVSIAFIALCAAYAHGCEKLRGAGND